MKGTDHLNVSDEALRLAMVLVHKDVEPPIAVGLFGDWGSGKSFFMSEMRKLISRISEQSQTEDGPFCGHVVQLEFNAWHYMDSDLWASLAREIFEGLATSIADRETSPLDLDLERERLRAATRSTKDLIAVTEVQMVDVQRQLDETKRKQIDVVKERKSVQEVARATVLVALQTPEVKAKLQAVASDLQLDQLGKSVGDLNDQLKEITGLAELSSALVVGLRQQWKGLVIGLVLVAVAAVVIDEVVGRYGEDIAATVTRVVSWLGVALTMLTTVGRHAKTVLGRLRAFRRELDAKLEPQREAKRQALDEDLKRLAAEREKHEDDLERLKELSRKLGRLDAGRQLVDFIRQRDASSDYRSQLGTVARASQDFKRLSDLMARAAAARKRKAAGKPEAGDEEDAKLPRIDRIVLYIDDLDRCPKDKVVNVLEAVHLLLAYPLFVVVVGVDPRWLLHSLEAHTAAFRLSAEPAEPAEPAQPAQPAENDANADWRSTSLDYLEKIFQIPYTLRPMGSEGFTRLVNDLSGWKEWTPTSLAQSRASELSPPVGVHSPPVAASPADGVPERLELNPSVLELDPREQLFMPRLHELIPTPRAAKRFVNVYRLIRASIAKGSDLHWFLDGGEFAAAQILLAMVSGAPAESSEILEKLLALSKRDAMTTQWWELVDHVVKPHLQRPNWRRFNARLESLRRDHQVPSLCDSYRKWADDVARYSFHSGRVLLGAQTRLDGAEL